MNAKLTSAQVQAVLDALPALVGIQPQLHLPSEVLPQLLADYYRVVEIAHHVRRGGIKAMIYRLETGKTKNYTADYFDEATERLSRTYRQYFSTVEVQESGLLERLRDITAEEEEAVQRLLPELDALLIQDRRLEAVRSDEQPDSRSSLL